MNILGEPVGASILAYLLLGEQLTTLQWAGGLLVMIVISQYICTREEGKLSGWLMPFRMLHNRYFTHKGVAMDGRAESIFK